MDGETSRRVFFVDDRPAEKDELAVPGRVGPHEKVARTIADLIGSEGHEGGRLIGIEGEWGSGSPRSLN